MARTRKGTKPPGHDFWGKRPANSHDDKQLTHSIERTEAKKDLKTEPPACHRCGHTKRIAKLWCYICAKCKAVLMD